MEDENSFLHRQLSMQTSSFKTTENHSYTHICEELYMASALENKSRELAVLIFAQNLNCLVLFHVRQ